LLVFMSHLASFAKAPFTDATISPFFFWGAVTCFAEVVRRRQPAVRRRAPRAAAAARAERG
jgi:hypothetical protein